MASGHRHWRARLARLSTVPIPAPPGHRSAPGARELSRAERRQLRKLLGRAYAFEWRLFGNIRRHWAWDKPAQAWVRIAPLRSAHPDPLNTLIARNVQANGHVAQRQQAERGRS